MKLPCLALLLATAALAGGQDGILALQRQRATAALDLGGSELHLTNLHPPSNAWFLLAQGGITDHLENPAPATQRVELRGAALHLVHGDDDVACAPWADGTLAAARQRRIAYVPLCGGRLYLRNRVAGHATDLERATDFLRDHVWGGDALVGFVRRQFYTDRYLERGTTPERGADARGDDAHAPIAATVDEARAPTMAPSTIGIDIGMRVGAMRAGRWYPAAGLPGVYVSFAQPQLVAARPGVLDPVEADALVYLAAFDLDAFDLAFALGTDHPRVGWSDRAPASVRDGLAGPDGFDTVAPLMRTGMVPPYLAARTVAAFTGGFKRQHGAFKYGELATRNRGSHYGFAEQGVVFSTLQPGLATLYVLDDGTVDMKTWRSDDAALLPRLRDARQNGVALVEPDATGRPVPGALVMQWGPGNWSGSAEEKLRTLRAGVCLQQRGAERFLVYGWFSTATPASMAQTFLAYGCRYAMMLDMNALEHTYLALYRTQQGRVAFEHLVQGMAEVDLSDAQGSLPRFLAYPDDRDFFYLTRREERR